MAGKSAWPGAHQKARAFYEKAWRNRNRPQCKPRPVRLFLAPNERQPSDRLLSMCRTVRYCAIHTNQRKTPTIRPVQDFPPSHVPRSPIQHGC